MEEFIKKLPSKQRCKKIFGIFAANLISVFVILAILFGIAWQNRAQIFKYLAGEYLKNISASSEKGNSIGSGTPAANNIFSQESFVIRVVKETSPAVVSIVLTKNVPKYVLVPGQDNQNNNPFGDLFPGFPNFFFNTPQYKQQGTEQKEIGAGSGFFVSPDGLIVTNKHVVDQKGVKYTVFTNDGKKHPATVVAIDPLLDIALLKIESSGGPVLPELPNGIEKTKPPYAIKHGYPYLSLGDSDKLEVGQTVIAIGNALGEFRNTVSVGVVSGLARNITAGDSATGKSEILDQVIQTDAAINPGNSGGPLLDLSGKVIGIDVALAQGSQNIGFALPINSVKGVIQSVQKTGKISHPYLGVRYVLVTPALSQANGLSVDYGALVKSGSNPNQLPVIPGGPADKAGIVENDIILEIDGQKIDQDHTLASIISRKQVGDTISLKVLHKGKEETLKATLENVPTNLK